MARLTLLSFPDIAIQKHIQFTRLRGLNEEKW